MTSFSLGPRAASAGYRLAAFDSIGSTNAEALARAREGERGPIWFVTSEQTAGRGRRHRPWIAPRGNLASSVLEVIDVPPAVAATLGFAAGLGAGGGAAKGQRRGVAALGGIGTYEVFAEMAQRRAGRATKACRHPAGGRSRGGRSAGGRGRHRHQCRCGAGGHADAGDLAGRARRRYRRGGVVRRRCRMLGRIPRHLGRRPRVWRDPAAAGWSARPGSGSRSQIKTGGSTVEGTFDTIDETGCMVVRTSDGKRIPISAGDVYFGSAASAGAA